MGWFESQVEERRRSDDERLEAALRRLSDAVTGKRTAEANSTMAQATGALDIVLAYYGVEGSEAPRGVVDVRELIDARLRSTGIMYRPVRLSKGWYHDAMGAMLGFADDGLPVALVPQARGGYCFYDGMGAVTVNARTAERLAPEAFCFYRPLPQKELGVLDILMYMVRSLDRSDYVAVLLASLAVTLLGMVAPRVNQVVFGPVIEMGDIGIVGPVAALLVGVLFAQVFVGGIKQMVMTRISTKLNLPLEAAVMMRVLSLPASFFGSWQSGDLAARVNVVSAIAGQLQNIVLSAGLNSLFSLAYVAQISNIAPALAAPALLVVAVTTIVTVVVALAQMRIVRKQLEVGMNLSGWQLGLIGGVQKIRLAGAEKRAFST